jgi:glycosyltransferase involved in cell wall biosynthesis
LSVSSGRGKPVGCSISVVIPTHNRAHLVTRAVDSALAAVAAGDEIIVVDDGSTDETEGALARYGSAIRYVKTENRGAGAARNQGVRLARHDWIAFLDSDDEWLTDHLDLHRKFLAGSDVLFSFSNFDIHCDGPAEKSLRRMQLVAWTGDHRHWDEIIGKGSAYSQFATLPAGRSDFQVHVGNLYHIMLRASYTPAWTSLVRRDAAGGLLRFPEDLPTFEDYECYIRLSRHGSAAYLDCATAINHGHGGPRLTGVADVMKADTRLAILNRTYGADDDFLRSNRAEFDAAMKEMNLFRAKEFLRRGAAEEARKVLGNVDSPPLVLRLLSVLPGSLVRGLWIFREMASGKRTRENA